MALDMAGAPYYMSTAPDTTSVVPTSATTSANRALVYTGGLLGTHPGTPPGRAATLVPWRVRTYPVYMGVYRGFWACPVVQGCWPG